MYDFIIKIKFLLYLKPKIVAIFISLANVQCIGYHRIYQFRLCEQSMLYYGRNPYAVRKYACLNTALTYENHQKHMSRVQIRIANIPEMFNAPGGNDIKVQTKMHGAMRTSFECISTGRIPLGAVALMRLISFSTC